MASKSFSFILLFICSRLSNSYSIDKRVTVRELVSGSVKGSVRTVLGKQVEVFLGIPYAEPPIGSLRFERPVAIKPWSSIRDAKVLPPMCIQYDREYVGRYRSNYTEENEDCLFVNVFVPKRNNHLTTKLPVYAYIHGGSNILGGALMLDGAVFAAETDVIVVTIAFRLGALGFMGIPETVMQGDYAIYDQILALKWIQKNIVAFGGDRKRVTLAGQSAGSWDVGVHLLSPLSKGLFQRAICISGSILSSNSHGPQRQFKDIQEYANEAGCKNKTLHAIKSCLQNQNAKDLTVHFLNLHYRSYSKCLKSNTLQCRTKYIRRHESVMYPSDILPDRPEILIQNASNINADYILLGVNSDETGGWISPADEKKNWTEWAYEFASHLEDPAVRRYLISPLSVDMMKHEYMNWNEPKNTTEVLYAKTDAFNDVMFDIATRNLAEKLAKASKNVYLYVFDYESKLSETRHRGMIHDDSLFYLFGSPLVGHPKKKYDRRDKSVSKLAMKLWGNFVKCGDPFLNVRLAPTSTKYDSENQSYFKIHSEHQHGHISYKNHFKNRKANFWNVIMPKLPIKTD